VEFLRTAFEEIAAWVTEESDLNIPFDQLEFDVYDNPRGQPNCQGKTGYRGLVGLKLDLTAGVLPPVRREVIHPYSDRPEDGIWAKYYA
jgi:hypothetical protein